MQGEGLIFQIYLPTTDRVSSLPALTRRATARPPTTPASTTSWPASANGHAPNLTRLSVDDRQTVELACINAKSEGPAAYHACLYIQLARLGNVHAPGWELVNSELAPIGDVRQAAGLPTVTWQPDDPNETETFLAQLGPIAPFEPDDRLNYRSLYRDLIQIETEQTLTPLN